MKVQIKGCRIYCKFVKRDGIDRCFNIFDIKLFSSEIMSSTPYVGTTQCREKKENTFLGSVSAMCERRR